MDVCRKKAIEGKTQKAEASLADSGKGPDQRWEGGMPTHHNPPDLSGPATDYINFQAAPEDGSPNKADTLL